MCKTPSIRHLWSCTTSSACWRRESFPNTALPVAFGVCSRKARSAVTASNAVPAYPERRRMAVARMGSRAGSTVSKFKIFSGFGLKLLGEKRGQPEDDTRGGRVPQPGETHIEKRHHPGVVR